MKKCLLSILLATVLLCACAQQTDNTLQTPESSTLVELTVATEETAVETSAPLATESPAPAPTQTSEPTATPAPTEIPIPEPTAAPTEAPATEPVAAESQPAQVSMSYGAVPFDLAAGSEEWWSIDSSDSVILGCAGKHQCYARSSWSVPFDDGQWPECCRRCTL